MAFILSWPWPVDLRFITGKFTGPKIALLYNNLLRTLKGLVLNIYWFPDRERGTGNDDFLRQRDPAHEVILLVHGIPVAVPLGDIVGGIVDISHSIATSTLDIIA